MPVPPVDPGRTALAWYPIAAVALSATAFIAVKTGRDAVFFSQGGLGQLPLVYILMAAASMPAGMLHLASIRRFGARRTRTAVFLAAAALFSAFVPFVDAEHPSAMLALFSLVPAAFAAVFAGGWLLAGDLLEGAGESTLRRAYSRIGAASMLGGMAGGIAARSLAPVLGPRGLVAAGAVILVLAAAIVARGHRARPVPASPEAPAGPGRSGTAPAPAGRSRSTTPLALLRHPYVRRLAAISGLAAIVALFIDFQFYAVATLNGHADARFFAGFYTALNAVALVLQLAAAPWIQARYGVGGALLVLPLALLCGLAGAATLGVAVLGRSVLRVTEGGLKSSIHRSSWEQVFLPIGAARDMAKVVVDGPASRAAEGLAALTLLLWMRTLPALDAGVSLAWMSWAILAGILAWLALARGLGIRRDGEAAGADPLVRIPDCCPIASSLGKSLGR